MCMCACMCACACVGTGVQLETPGEPSLPSRVYCLELFRSLLCLTPTTVEARPHEFLTAVVVLFPPPPATAVNRVASAAHCPPSVPSRTKRAVTSEKQHSKLTVAQVIQPRSDNPHPRLAPTALCLPGDPLRQLPSPRTRAPRSAALARLRPRTPSAAAAHAHTAATETEPLMQLRPRLCLADLPLR